MKNKNLILEAGADGGSIKLFQIKDYFLFTTDESTLRAIDPNLTMEELQSKSDVFKSFAEVMKSLLERYPIFSLYPLTVNAKYKNKLIPYYQGFCSGSRNEQIWNGDNWDKFLFYESDSSK